MVVHGQVLGGVCGDRSSLGDPIVTGARDYRATWSVVAGLIVSLGESVT